MKVGGKCAPDFPFLCFLIEFAKIDAANENAYSGKTKEYPRGLILNIHESMGLKTIYALFVHSAAQSSFVMHLFLFDRINNSSGNNSCRFVASLFQLNLSINK